jgi:hypothetical protein
MSTSPNPNPAKKPQILTVEAAKNIVLNLKREPTQEEVLQEISIEIITQHDNGIPLKLIASALKSNGFTKVSLKKLQEICGIEPVEKLKSKPNEPQHPI